MSQSYNNGGGKYFLLKIVKNSDENCINKSYKVCICLRNIDVNNK